MPNLPLCHWPSQLFDLRAQSSTEVLVLLLNQPTSWFVPHGMCGTPQIKLPMKSSLQSKLILHTRTQNLNQKLLGDNGRCKAAKKKFAHMSAGS